MTSERFRLLITKGWDMAPIRVVLKWIVRTIFLAFALFILYMALEVTVISDFRHQRGLTLSGAGEKFSNAMKTGDGPAAIYWAEQMIKLAQANRGIPDGVISSQRSLALALELDGRYEEALAMHQKYAEWQFHEGRVYYKLGREEEAFKSYCDFALSYKEAGRITGHVSPSRVRPFRTQITGENYITLSHTFYPFRTYDQFLTFMRREWEKTGKAEEYREAMEFIEAVYSPDP